MPSLTSNQSFSYISCHDYVSPNQHKVNIFLRNVPQTGRRIVQATSSQRLVVRGDPNEKALCRGYATVLVEDVILVVKTTSLRTAF